MRTVQDKRRWDTLFNKTQHKNMYCMREEVNQTQLVGFNVFGIGSEETS